MTSVSFPKKIFEDLVAHLDRPEEVAFMLADPPEDGCFRIRELRIMGNERFTDQTDDFGRLDDAIRGEVIRWAWDTDACLIEAHSHGRLFLPVRFSGFDFDQFEEWVPHVRWRLGGRPYGALVTAGVQFDGLAWIGDSPEAIERIMVDGRADLPTSGASNSYLSEHYE